jgi:hypothetical protein
MFESWAPGYATLARSECACILRVAALHCVILKTQSDANNKLTKISRENIRIVGPPFIHP